jgi:hypothetical protein
MLWQLPDMCMALWAANGDRAHHSGDCFVRLVYIVASQSTNLLCDGSGQWT